MVSYISIINRTNNTNRTKISVILSSSRGKVSFVYIDLDLTVILQKSTKWSSSILHSTTNMLVRLLLEPSWYALSLLVSCQLRLWETLQLASKFSKIKNLWKFWRKHVYAYGSWRMWSLLTKQRCRKTYTLLTSIEIVWWWLNIEAYFFYTQLVL